jgi:hypothetical protein
MITKHISSGSEQSSLDISPGIFDSPSPAGWVIEAERSACGKRDRYLGPRSGKRQGSVASHFLKTVAVEAVGVNGSGVEPEVGKMTPASNCLKFRGQA